MPREACDTLSGGSVATWINLHDAWHADLLRSLLVLQGEYHGDADLAEYSIPKLVRWLHKARAEIPPEFRASDPDRLVAASVRRCLKNARKIATPRPSRSMEN